MILWVNLDQLDLSEAAPVRRLDVPAAQSEGRAGDVSARFVEAAPFEFEAV